MPSEAAKHWREKYGIGARFDNKIFIGPSDAVRFWKKHSINGESAEQALKRAAAQIAKQRSLNFMYKRGKKEEKPTLLFFTSESTKFLAS